MAYDLMQAAAAQTLFLDASGSGPLGAAKNLAMRLLTETRRSEQQIRLQQFSTPLPYAALAVRAAAIRNGETDDQVAERIKAAVATKWAGHRINQVNFIRPGKSMSQIGG